MEKCERLKVLIEGFRTAMLVTHANDGGLRSRPLAVADNHDRCALYFSTAIESAGVRELERDPHVTITMQDAHRFASLSGMARIANDRALVHRLWIDDWKAWFPQGRADPSLRILVLEPTEATWWHASRGVQGPDVSLRSGQRLRYGYPAQRG